MITKFNPEKGMNEVVYTKECQKCKKEKDLDEFRRQKKGKWGRKGYCKVCDDAYEKERYLKNSYARISQVKRWVNKNKEKVKLYKRDYNRRKNGAKPLTKEDLNPLD